MPNPRSVASIQPAVAVTSTVHFLRRILICLVQTGLNAVVIAKFGGILYRAAMHDPAQQAEVTLLFAALLGSLGRMWFLAIKSRSR